VLSGLHGEVAAADGCEEEEFRLEGTKKKVAMDFSQEDMSEFVKLVRDMRAKQVAFFANRTQPNMIVAKQAEKQVDGWLNHFAEIRLHQAEATVQQGKLL
jgi:hypothetical protein